MSPAEAVAEIHGALRRMDWRPQGGVFSQGAGQLRYWLMGVGRTPTPATSALQLVHWHPWSPAAAQALRLPKTLGIFPERRSGFVRLAFASSVLARRGIHADFVRDVDLRGFTRMVLTTYSDGGRLLAGIAGEIDAVVESPAFRPSADALVEVALRLRLALLGM